MVIYKNRHNGLNGKKTCKNFCVNCGPDRHRITKSNRLVHITHRLADPLFIDENHQNLLITC